MQTSFPMSRAPIAVVVLSMLGGCASLRVDETGKSGETPELPAKPQSLADASRISEDASICAYGLIDGGTPDARATIAPSPVLRLDGSDGSSTGDDEGLLDSSSSHYEDSGANESTEQNALADAAAAETCSTFRDVWAVRQRNLSNDPTLGDACFACVFYTECARPSSQCNAGTACVERNCLCTSDVNEL